MRNCGFAIYRQTPTGSTAPMSCCLRCCGRRQWQSGMTISVACFNEAAASGRDRCSRSLSMATEYAESPRLFSLFDASENTTSWRNNFDLLGNFWSERRDLNSGPPVPQTGALTGLRYAPYGGDYSGWRVRAQPIACQHITNRATATTSPKPPETRVLIQVLGRGRRRVWKRHGSAGDMHLPAWPAIAARPTAAERRRSRGRSALWRCAAPPS
jgi:hypothetical protein